MRLPPLLGIYENGFNRAPWLPLDTRVTLELYRSVDYVIPMQVVNSQGVPVDLTGVDTTVTMRIKKRPSDHLAVFEDILALTPILGPGTGTFALAASTLDFVVGGTYVWDVMLVLDLARSPLIALSPAIIMVSGSRSSC